MIPLGLDDRPEVGLAVPTMMAESSTAVINQARTTFTIDLPHKPGDHFIVMYSKDGVDWERLGSQKSGKFVYKNRKLARDPEGFFYMPLQQNLWVPRRRDSPRILTSNKLYPILMGIKVVATSQLPIQTSDLRGQRLRRGCPW